jgi:hypothetical protein
MIDYNFMRVEFIKKHINIDNYEYLDKYINFFKNYNIKENFEYFEKHHILPRSTFPEFKNEDWNIAKLDYDSHRLVHLWLFKAINIRKYQRPLNWMMNYYKNTEEISNAAKNGWINLKNNEEKYNKWRKSKSESMKKFRNSDNYKRIMIEYFNNQEYGESKGRKSDTWGDRFSSENQRRRANIFWNNINEKDYLKFCEKMKSYWTEEKRVEKSKQMNEYYSNPDNAEKKRRETKDRWDSLDESYRKNFKEKMSLINKDLEKRLDAGNKIKDKWKDPVYLEKMKNRKKRNGLKIKITKIDESVEIFENMEDIVKKYNFSTHLIRKYRDTNNRVLEKHLNSDNINLLGSKIETIKN